MDAILQKLGIDESLTKPVKRPKKFTKVQDNIPMKADYNFMADLLFLPKTKEGFRYLLVVVDLATKEFDVEPLKTKQPKEVLEAMEKMFKRPYIKKPYASIQTDSGREFDGVFQKYLYDQSILHKKTVPGRHSQNSMVESLNRQLGRLLNGYMNKKEQQTKKPYHEWTDALNTIRVELNKHRKKDLPKQQPMNIPDLSKNPKFKPGDVVLRQLDRPRNALNNNLGDEKFREGDLRWDPTPKKVEKVFYYKGAIPYRYKLSGLNNVSFTEAQLRFAPDEDQEKYEIKKIIGERTRNKQKEYLIWWKGYLKKDSTYEPEKQLIEDIGKAGVERYVKEYKASKK